MSLFFPDDTDDMYDYFPGEFVYGDDVYTPEEYMGEKWWYADGSSDYMVSDRGRVWSCKRQQFLTPRPGDKHGHKRVTMSEHSHNIYRYIHRLVAKAFIYNSNGDPNVLHEDDDPDNNFVENLRWGTQKDNHEDCVKNGHYKPFTDEIRELSAQKTRKPIIATNLKTGKETYFRGQQEASRILGIQQSNIWKVLNGKRDKTCGYKFRYVNAHVGEGA